jgi:hypothetical protein
VENIIAIREVMSRNINTGDKKDCDFKIKLIAR